MESRLWQEVMKLLKKKERNNNVEMSIFKRSKKQLRREPRQSVTVYKELAFSKPQVLVDKLC